MPTRPRRRPRRRPPPRRYDPLATAARKHYSETVQARMLTFMISKNLSARAASRHPQAPVRIPRSTLARWKQSYDWWGETPAATKRRIKKKLRGGRGRRSMSDVDVQALKHIVDRRPQLYLDQMQRALRRVLDVTFNIRTIHRYLTKPPA